MVENILVTMEKLVAWSQVLKSREEVLNVV